MNIATRKILVNAGLVYCAAIWGSTFIVTKGALADVGPCAMVCLRFAIAALMLLPVAFRRIDGARLMKEGFILSLFLSCLYLAQTAGLAYTSASNSGFITGMFIMFIPIFLYVFRKERPLPLQLASAAPAVLGLWLLTGGVKGFNAGDALTLLAAAAYSGHLIITDKCVKSGADTVLLAFHQFWMVSAISLLFSLITGETMTVASVRGWWTIVFLAIFPTLSAFYIQMLAQKKSDPFTVGMVFTLEPVFAAVFAWTLGGEMLTLVKVIGGGLIVSGMLLSELAGRFGGQRLLKE